MYAKFKLLVLTLAALGAASTVHAQKLPTVDDTPQNLADRQAIQNATVFFEALRLREAAATAIANGSEKPDAVIIRLKANSSPSGLKAEANADFGQATLDIGQRLVARNKSAEADVFFRECEKSFTVAMAKVPDANARDKAMILQKLALVRGSYLNNAVQAKADIEAAIKLQPDEKYFQDFRDGLRKEQGQTSTDGSK